MTCVGYGARVPSRHHVLYVHVSLGHVRRGFVERGVWFCVNHITTPGMKLLRKEWLEPSPGTPK